MILKHYTIKCPNNINDIIKELKKISNKAEKLYVNATHVNNNNFIILQIDEKQSQDLIELT